jgi:hypothetical protein
MVPSFARASVSLVLAAALLSSCSHEPTRSDAIAGWDDICRSTQSRLSKIQVPNVTSAHDLERFAGAMKKALPVVIDELNRLGMVQVPSADQKTVDRILSDLERSADQLHQAERSAKREKVDATKSAIGRSEKYTKAAGKLARSYGFKVCGRAA